MVVGAAARDVAPDDPRGWRLGGGVTYGALTLAGLGVHTLALVGVDAPAARAPELDLLRAAGVEVVPVALARGPVFENRETPGGRVQTCLQVSDPVVADARARALAGAPGWLFAPVAGEVGDEWAAVPGARALVAVGWQGLLRELQAGQRTRRRPPWPSALVSRADLVGVSHLDLDPGTRIDALRALCRADATLVLTDGDRGGLVLEAGRERRYPAIRAERTVDPTGAGDVFLAALLAARVAPARFGTASRPGLALRLAAAAASLVVERPGLLGVPALRAVLGRMARIGSAA